MHYAEFELNHTWAVKYNTASEPLHVPRWPYLRNFSTFDKSAKKHEAKGPAS